ncbi:chemotaxis protein CheA [Caldalkalibacillus mannanilyticus]|uniref:chemotaxis protein CheA n=1 Tax=Caldalkalibacillus mannanilyticus TaxID=1418 RepID=UPI000469363E|nr:chemotaxis protein CheA [Caldalkalibacillus mannanilyticus]
MDMNQYLDMFIEEAQEHLQAINQHLLNFEKEPTNIGIINEIFRSAHTLKGMSATMGFEDLASLTHEMENVLDLLRNHKIVANVDIIDVIFKSVDALEGMVQSIIETGNGKADVTHIVNQLSSIVNGDFKGNSTTASTPTSSTEAENQVAELEDVNTNMTIDEFELTVIKQSIENGFNVLNIAVALRDNCVLRAVRAYMVFDLLEKNGEVIKSNPSVEDIEEEKFDLSFEVMYVTKESAENIQQMILKVSEIEKAEVVTINVNQLKLTNGRNQNVTSEETSKEQVQPPVSAPEKAEASVPTPAPLAESDVADVKNSQQSRNQNRTIRVNIDRLDVLMNLFSELVIDRGRLEQISKEVKHQELEETVEHMSRISVDLQNIILNMRMVQIEQVFNRFPRMIRGLAKDLNKKVDLQISGAETELDRTVIDEIGDPLVHLLRNAVDHGLETTEERLKAGKPEEGIIQLKAYHSGNHVFIEIIDDGKGINRDNILKKALEKNIVSREKANELSDQEVFQLLFASGFSTADVISDISGRGVGLDVVKNKIESLGGSVSVDSKLGEGTTFSIQLPLTLSILSAMLVQLGEAKYAIPLTSIIETAVFKKEQILSAHRQKVIDFRGKVVPLVFLKDVFNEPVTEGAEEFISVVIVRKGEKLAGLVVDSFIGQQEIVLKSLGNYLTNVFAISGATILGDGQVALIIDCNALIK